MTNPGNAVGTNAAYSGRTSAKAFNDDLVVYSRGIMSGWECAPNSGMSVVLGGNGTTRDVAIAEDNAGNKTTINNISGSPISVNIPSAPASNSRIDSIVAYVDNPPQGSATITDNYEACGLIVVSGTASSSPVVPTENAIRTAITTDGASGSTASYVVLANVTVASGTTDIIADDITAGDNTLIQARNIDFNSLNDKVVTILKFNKQATQNGTLTRKTLKGTTLTITYEGYGQRFNISSGADNIKYIHQTYSIKASSATTSEYGVAGVTNNAKVYTYQTGKANGQNAANYDGERSSSGSTSDLCITNGGQKTYTLATVDFIKFPDNNSWAALGSAISSGSATAISFIGEIISVQSGGAPAFFQYGMSNPASTETVFEIYE